MTPIALLRIVAATIRYCDPEDKSFCEGADLATEVKALRPQIEEAITAYDAARNVALRTAVGGRTAEESTPLNSRAVWPFPSKTPGA